jgi:RNA polymerase sigma factor for flagellar operon FliA
MEAEGTDTAVRTRGVEATITPDPEIAALWFQFSTSRDPQVRDRLIGRYAALARVIAAKLYGTRPDNSVPFDDYLQYARVGLIEAIDRYDSTRGASFETYATYRVRGAVLNGLTRETEARASRNRGAARIQEREESLAREMLSHPDDASLEDFVRLSVGLAIGFALDDASREPTDESVSANPYAQAESGQLRERIRVLIEQLPPREQEIMRRHYYEQLEFQEVAVALGVSKGRVSQLHARALSRVRAWLGGGSKIDRSI